MQNTLRDQEYSDIAILIPTINEITLAEVVKAAYSEMPGAEIIILGFGSARTIAEKFATSFIDLKEKTKKSIAINLAVQSTKKNKFIILDADAIPTKGWGKAMQQEFESSKFFSCRAEISNGNYWMRAYNLSMLHTFATQKRKIAEEYIPLFCTGFTREIYNQIGPISEDIDRGQDYEWSLRARKNGITPIFTPIPVVKHIPILKTSVIDLWNYWVETGKANLRIRLMYPELLQTPRLLLSPIFLAIFLPILALLPTLRIIYQSLEIAFACIYLLPAVYFSKIAYSYGFFLYALSMKR